MFFALVASLFVEAEELALWELGFGFGGLHQPYYVGTKQTRGEVFPVVIPVYRGDIFKADDKGMRAEFFKNDRYKIDVSADFSFSVDSDDIDLRKGMNDIGNLLELGPSLEYKLFQNEVDSWLLKFPVRIVTEIDDRNLSSSGISFAPSLSLEKKIKDSSVKLGISISLKLGDEKYNSIYYSVAPRYQTIDRPSYDARSGYAGSRFQLALTSKANDNLLVFFLRYDNINGAVFDDSPLVEVKDSVTLGFIYNRYFFKSKKLVYR